MNTNSIQTGPAIFLFGLIVAIAILITNSPKTEVKTTEQAPTTLAFNLKDPNEHVLGSVDAKIVMVEYSDIDCPFCRRFHPVMEQIVKARATECVSAALGNDAFWNYTNTLFTTDVSIDKLDDEAVKIGMSSDDFKTCMNSTAPDEAVQADIQSGIALGTKGTPNTIIVNSKGEQEIVQGAADYASVKAKIDKLLAK